MEDVGKRTGNATVVTYPTRIAARKRHFETKAHSGTPLAGILFPSLKLLTIP